MLKDFAVTGIRTCHLMVGNQARIVYATDTCLALCYCYLISASLILFINNLLCFGTGRHKPVVHEDRGSQCVHSVPHDRRARYGREVPRADQRPAGLGRDPGHLRRGRDRGDRQLHPPGSEVCRHSGHQGKLLEVLHRQSQTTAQGQFISSFSIGNKMV